MNDPASTLILAIAALAVFAAAFWFWSARIRESTQSTAFQQGRASREGELIALTHERDAQTERAKELHARLAALEAEAHRLRERSDQLSDERAALS